MRYRRIFILVEGTLQGLDIFSTSDTTTKDFQAL